MPRLLSTLVTSLVASFFIVGGAGLRAAGGGQEAATLDPLSWRDITIDFTSVPTQIGDDNKVRLVNGLWRDLEDAGFEFTLQERFARGDLDGDGIEDAVVIVKQATATDAEHYWLVGLLNRAGKPQPIAPPMMIGDGISIDKLIVEPGGVIRAEVIEGRTEAYAGRVRFAFRVANGRLIAVAR